MRKTMISLLPALALLATPALAREPERPVTDQDPSAVDVVATPADDLNLRKDEIPALLLAAQERPYTLADAGSCAAIAAEIGELDAVLGEDVDIPQEGGRRVRAGRVAQSVVGSFIPFRGVIREISGANSRDRQLQAAILAGFARRGFLKGTGQARGCRYPARSATLDIYNERMAKLYGQAVPAGTATASVPAATSPQANADTPVRYVSRPMVQQAN